MAVKKRVNDVLGGLTGYQLTRRPAPKPARAPGGKSAATKSKGETYPKDFEEQATEILEAVRPWTMTSNDKLYALYLSVQHVARHRIPGDVVECGVWRGGSMQAIARTLIAEGDTTRDLHLFDTFEGMPEPGEKDVRLDGAAAATLMEKSERQAGRGVWAYATLEDVRDGMSRTGYPAERVHYVQGKVEDTLPAEAPERISVLRLDTDWYSSTKHELDVLYPRLVSGGILLLDDYGWWKGSREAVHEFLEETGERLLLMRMGTGRVAVKP